jgi:integrase
MTADQPMKLQARSPVERQSRTDFTARKLERLAANSTLTDKRNPDLRARRQGDGQVILELRYRVPSDRSKQRTLRLGRFRAEGSMPNPTEAVDLNKERDRKDTALKADELAAWRRQIEDLLGVVRDYSLTLLYSGLRRRDAAALRAEDIDLDRQVIRVPDPKGGKSRACR